MEVDVRPAFEDVGDLQGQSRIVALRQIPFPADHSSDASGKGRDHVVIRAGFIERSTEEPPDHRVRQRW